jgi:hypothetical protein
LLASPLTPNSLAPVDPLGSTTPSALKPLVIAASGPIAVGTPPNHPLGTPLPPLGGVDPTMLSRGAPVVLPAVEIPIGNGPARTPNLALNANPVLTPNVPPSANATPSPNPSQNPRATPPWVAAAKAGQLAEEKPKKPKRRARRMVVTAVVLVGSFFGVRGCIKHHHLQASGQMNLTEDGFDFNGKDEYGRPLQGHIGADGVDFHAGHGSTGSSKTPKKSEDEPNE